MVARCSYVKFLTDFRSGKAPILVATDVAARGLGMYFNLITTLKYFNLILCLLTNWIFLFLDVDDVKFVINFDYPSNSEDYVHRIGRTGRTNKTGTAYTFFTPSNAAKAADLVAVLKEAKQVVNPKLQELAERGGGGGRRKCCVIILLHKYLINCNAEKWDLIVSFLY